MLPWVREQVEARNDVAETPAVLHLFAYTGLVTLALAAAGARVTHLDASRPTVAWARSNAALSGLADRPIRWIVDDATAFTTREVRRGRRYAGVVLDPPSYGHGPGAAAWRIGDDLPPILATIASLLVPGGFLLLTAHTPELGPERLAGMVARAIDRPPTTIEHGELALSTSDGRRVELGAFARSSGRAS
jgi:23S rRNA (cytosine1962-C5)-methyltransferase